MHDTMDKIYNTLCRALETESNEKLTPNSLDNIFKIVNTMYKIDKMYGDDSDYSLDDGMSHGRYSYRGRGRGAKRDSMGRYSRDNVSHDNYSNDYSNDGYSRHNKEEFRMEFQRLMQDAPDENTRQMMRQWMNQIDK